MIYLNDEIGLLPLEKALQEISEQRREQALRFRHEQGRRLSVAAYLLLKEGLQQEYGMTDNPVFSYSEKGKPSIAGRSDIHFNLSHCREAAICALSATPVGVDIESVREYRESLVAYTMSEEEVEYIRHSQRPDVAFTCLWTQKESLLKFTGEGIHNDMKHVLADIPLGVKITTVVNLQRHYVYSICQ